MASGLTLKGGIVTPRAGEATDRVAGCAAEGVSARLSRHKHTQGRDDAMDASALKELQAPFKQRYRDEPAAAVITLRAEGASAKG